jgi:thymidylate kinase
MVGVVPMLTIFIELDPHIAFARIQARGNRLTSIESRGPDYLQRVQNGFETLFKNRSNILRLDGRLTQEAMLQKTLEYLALTHKTTSIEL